MSARRPLHLGISVASVAAFVPSGAVDLQIVVYAGRATAVPGGEATSRPGVLRNDTSGDFNAPRRHAAEHPPRLVDSRYQLRRPHHDRSTFSVHGDFYRVISISTIDNSHVNLELQDPISKPTGISAVTVIDNVADVFKRGTFPSNQWEFRDRILEMRNPMTLREYTNMRRRSGFTLVEVLVSMALFCSS